MPTPHPSQLDWRGSLPTRRVPAVLQNSTSRLASSSLILTAQQQYADFEAEFTQHQRDVFCVFSGNMVSKFRDFLNTSPQYEALRESLYPRYASHIRAFTARRAYPTTVQPPDAENFDDEMNFEDNDFEGLDTSEMVVDAQQNLPFHVQHPGAFPTMQPTVPPMPGVPHTLEPPTATSSTDFLAGMLTRPFPPRQRAEMELLLAENDDFALPRTFGFGNPANGMASGSSSINVQHASVAGLSQPSVSQQSNLPAAGPSAGASTVTMHQPTRPSPDEQQGGAN